jgi:competence protein ComGC
MLQSQFAKHRKKRGFYMIGILIALVIIMILTYNQLAPGPGSDASSPQQQIDKGERAACSANRQTLRTRIASWKINHTNETISIEAMEKSGVNVPQCPAGGEITIDPEGNVFCSIHAPVSDPATSQGAAQPDVQSVMDVLNQ